MEQSWVTDIDNKWIPINAVEIEVITEEDFSMGKATDFQQELIEYNMSKRSFSEKNNSKRKPKKQRSTLDSEKNNSKRKPKKKRSTSDFEAYFEFDANLNKFVCRKCGKYFKRKKYVVTHLRRVCGLEPRFTCEFCPFKSKSQNFFNVHMSSKKHKDVLFSKNLTLKKASVKKEKVIKRNKDLVFEKTDSTNTPNLEKGNVGAKKEKVIKLNKDLVFEKTDSTNTSNLEKANVGAKKEKVIKLSKDLIFEKNYMEKEIYNYEEEHSLHNLVIVCSEEDLVGYTESTNFEYEFDGGEVIVLEEDFQNESGKNFEDGNGQIKEAPVSLKKDAKNEKKKYKSSTVFPHEHIKKDATVEKKKYKNNNVFSHEPLKKVAKVEKKKYKNTTVFPHEPVKKVAKVVKKKYKNTTAFPHEHSYNTTLDAKVGKKKYKNTTVFPHEHSYNTTLDAKVGKKKYKNTTVFPHEHSNNTILDAKVGKKKYKNTTVFPHDHSNNTILDAKVENNILDVKFEKKFLDTKVQKEILDSKIEKKIWDAKVENKILEAKVEKTVFDAKVENKTYKNTTVFPHVPSISTILKEPKKVIRFVDIPTNSKYITDASDKTLDEETKVLLKDEHNKSVAEKHNFHHIPLETSSSSNSNSFHCELLQNQLLEKGGSNTKAMNSKLPSFTESLSKQERTRNSRHVSDVEDEYVFVYDVNKYKCKRCGKLFKIKTSVVHHLLNICGVEPKHLCALCPYKTKSSISLKVHVAKLHRVSHFQKKYFSQDKASKDQLSKTNKLPKTIINTYQKSYSKSKSGSDEITSEDEDSAFYKPDGQDFKRCDPEKSLAGNESICYSELLERTSDSEFEEEYTTRVIGGEPQKESTNKIKRELKNENEFIFNVKLNHFECKSCHKVFKNKSVVALHKHVYCRNLKNP